jgi:hypothetical protein
MIEVRLVGLKFNHRGDQKESTHTLAASIDVKIPHGKVPKS